jgi:hypothetical protein
LEKLLDSDPVLTFTTDLAPQVQIEDLTILAFAGTGYFNGMNMILGGNGTILTQGDNLAH